MGKKIIKETIHAKGVEIGIYTADFENEFISLTDIAKYNSLFESVCLLEKQIAMMPANWDMQRRK